MIPFKRKRETLPSAVGVASVPQTFGKNDCFKGFGGEMSLYDNLRSSVPVIDAAIGKIVRLTGGLEEI